MLAVRRFYLRSLVLGLLVLGCNANEVVEPTIDAASSAAAGSKLNAPSIPKAMALSYSQIEFSWQDNSNNETGFEVQRSTSGASGPFTELAVTGPGAVAYSDGGLTPSTAYCYQVRAFRTTGNKKTYSAFTSAACATTLPPVLPGAPFGAWSRPTNSTSVEVSWSDTSSNEDGFRVERSTDGAITFALATTTGPNQVFVTSIVDGDRITGVSVCYRVIAFNAVGDSPPKSAGCVTPPRGPTDLTAAKVGPQVVSVSWMDRSGSEHSYELQRSTEEGGPFATVATGLLPRWWFGTVSYLDTVPSRDAVYWYRARAVTSGGGFSDFSNTGSAGGEALPPTAPGPVEAQPFATSMDVAWADNSNNEEGFRVERSTDGGTSWVIAGTNGANVQTFYENWSSAEVEVCYRIFAFNSVGSSPPSPMACTALPATPGPLAATFVDDDTVDLVWADNSSFEESYEVWAGICGGGFYAIADLPANATTIRVAELADNGYTRLLVRARKGQWGYSHFSNEVWPYPDACQF